MRELFSSAMQNLLRKRGRSSLTMLGVAIGVASVLVIGSISQCGADALTREMDSLGLNGIAISAAQESGAALSQEDLNVIRQNRNVQQAMPILMQNASAVAREYETPAMVWGIDANANRMISLSVQHGRAIHSGDIRSSAQVCLVDEKFSQASYSRENIVGKRVSILCGGQAEEFLVVGVVKTGSGLLQNMIGDYIPTFLYIPYTTMQSMLGKSSFDQIAVKLNPKASLDAVGQELAARLDAYHGQTGAYTSSNLTKQRESLTNILEIVTLALSAVGAISLLVASLSIMTVMLVSVKERTREIGIKKAIGAQRSVILLEFLLEALLLTVFGCMFGSVLGYGISFGGAALLGLPLPFRADLFLAAIGFSLLSGLLFGVYPAMKASALKPVDALRTE